MISSNGEFWVRQRRMIQPAFKREAVARHYEVFTDAALALRDRWLQAAARREAVDVTHDVSMAVLEITLRCIFGPDYGAVADKFAVIAEESRNLEFAQTCRGLSQVIMGIVAERRAQGRESNDLLDTMMNARDRDSGQPMSDAQMARESLTLVIAGHETTASLLNWLWYLLAKWPAVEAGLHAEVDRLLPDGAAPAYERLADFKYSRQVLEEALRSYPPLWLMTRKAMVEDRLGPYEVPSGTEIYISPFLLQRHPRFWESAEQFDPGRFAAGDSGASHALAMCPFGAGPRNCIGEYFARVEMQVQVLIIARQLRLAYEVAEPADWVARVNLLSRHHFMMLPARR